MFLMFREIWEPNELAARIFLGVVLYGAALAGLRLVSFVWANAKKAAIGSACKKQNNEGQGSGWGCSRTRGFWLNDWTGCGGGNSSESFCGTGGYVQGEAVGCGDHQGRGFGDRDWEGLGYSSSSRMGCGDGAGSSFGKGDLRGDGVGRGNQGPESEWL